MWTLRAHGSDKYDGLNDAYDGVAMGEFAELCAETHKISREDQDQYAAESYRRALAATKSGKFQSEIEPMEIQSRRGQCRTRDGFCCFVYKGL